MTAAAIIHQLAAHGVQIEAAGTDALTLKGKAPPPDLLQQVRQCKRQLLEHLHRLPCTNHATCTDTGLESMGLGVVPIAAPEPLPKPPAAQPAPDWQQLHHDYMMHAKDCQQCKAASRAPNYGQYGYRCHVGDALWLAYDATPYPYTHQKPRPDYNLPHGGKTND